MFAYIMEILTMLWSDAYAEMCKGKFISRPVWGTDKRVLFRLLGETSIFEHVPHDPANKIKFWLPKFEDFSADDWFAITLADYPVVAAAIAEEVAPTVVEAPVTETVQ